MVFVKGPLLSDLKVRPPAECECLADDLRGGAKRLAVGTRRITERSEDLGSQTWGNLRVRKGERKEKKEKEREWEDGDVKATVQGSSGDGGCGLRDYAFADGVED
jgi:hypothetical protein